MIDLKYREGGLLRTTFTTILLAASFMAGCTDKTGEQLYRDGLSLVDGNPNGAIVLFRNALAKNQNLLEARWELAKAYGSTGKLELAEKELQKAVRLNPARLDLHLELARLYNRMKLPDQALKAVEPYLKSRPESADALEVMGVAYGLKNMAHLSENYLVQALLRDHGRSGTTLRLAELYASQKKYEQARSLLGDLINRDHRNLEAHHILAELEVNAGRKREALALYRRLEALDRKSPIAPYRAGLLCLELGDQQGASNRAAALIRSFSASGEGHRLKGIISYRAGNYREAVSSFQTANNSCPTVSGTYLLGLAFYKMDKAEDALAHFRTVLDAVPDFHQARLLCGMLLFKLKRYDESITELRSLTDMDRRNAMAHNILGSVHLTKGNYEEGMRALNRAAACDPQLVDTYFKKGIVYLGMGRTADVERELKTAVRVAPRLAGSRLVLASFYLQRHNPDKAFETLRSGLCGKPGDAALYVAMARIRFAQCKQREASGYLHQAKTADPAAVEPGFALAYHYSVNGNMRKAIEECREILKRQPGNLRALLDLAGLLETAGRGSEARETYLAIRQLKTPEAYHALAERFGKANQWTEARTLLEDGIRLAPRSLELHEATARMYLKARQYREALKSVGDVETINPAKGLELRVDVLLAMQRFTEANQLAMKAISQQPARVEGYLLAARVQREQGRNDLAVRTLRQEIAANGSDPRIYLALGELHAADRDFARAARACSDGMLKFPENASLAYSRGIYQEQLGRYRDAVLSYRKATVLAPDFAAPMNNLAYLSCRGYGTRREALKLATTAAALEPGNPRVLDTLGYALLSSGRAADAQQMLARADAIKPGDSTINYHLALAHRAKGERGLAVVRLQRALKGEQFSDERQARILLADLD